MKIFISLPLGWFASLQLRWGSQRNQSGLWVGQEVGPADEADTFLCRGYRLTRSGFGRSWID